MIGPLFLCDCARNCAHCLECAHGTGTGKRMDGTAKRGAEKWKRPPGEVALMGTAWAQFRR